MSSKQKYVYLLKAGRRYKIGVSLNVEARVKQLQTGNSKAIKEVFSKRKKNAFYIEKSLHTIFHRKRLNGEWFRLNWLDRVLIRFLLWYI